MLADHLESRFLFLLVQLVLLSTLLVALMFVPIRFMYLGWCCYLRLNSECAFVRWVFRVLRVSVAKIKMAGRYEPRRGESRFPIPRLVAHQAHVYYLAWLVAHQPRILGHKLFNRQMYLRQHTPCAPTPIFFDGVKWCINNSAILFKCSNLLSI